MSKQHSKKAAARERPSPDLSAESGHDDADDAPAEPVSPTGDAIEALSPKQAQAVEALLQGQPMARAAAAAAVNERTLRRWVREPVFRSALLEARREAFAQAVGLTQRYAPVAVATLVKVMNDASAPASAKVTAAAVVLKFGREGIELDDLAERVDALERAAKVAPWG